MTNRGKITQETIEWYHSRGFELTVLSNVIGDRHRGKRPRYKDWVTKDIDPDIIADAAAEGLNLGWRIPETHAIFDIDPRHGGDTALEKIQQDFCVKLADHYPVVRTGSDGWHVYFALPGPSSDYVAEIDAYPGIDLRKHGSQCVIPNSYHYTAKSYYQWDLASRWELKKIPEMRPEVLNLWRRQTPTAVQTHLDGPQLDDSDLKQILDQIPADQYDSNNRWFPMLCASHHITGGKGLAAFLNWSTSDPKYIGQDDIITARWQSLGTKATSITYKSLIQALYEHKGKLPVDIQAKIDFVSHPDIHEVHSNSTQTADKYRKARDVWATLADRIAALSGDSGQDEIEDVLSDVARLKPIDRDRAVTLVKKATGRSVGVLRKLVERLAIAHQTRAVLDKDGPSRYGIGVSDALSGDLATHIAITVVDQHFDRGRGVCVGPDGQVWAFKETHWSPVQSYLLDQLAVTAIDGFVRNNPGTTVPTDTVSRSAVSLIPKIIKYDPELFMSPSKEYTIINTLSSEVWVNNRSGDLTIKPHTPDSRQLGVTSFGYDANATAPLFEESLANIFANDNDREETIRHLLELYGYTIQPRKNHAAWVLLHGGGSNGKTILLSILTKLTGERVLSCPIQDIDTKRSAHIMAALVGKLAIVDDDVEPFELLPAGALKKLSENKNMTANPKQRDMFEFENTSIAWLASNGWPYARDGSHGMQRRANVFELTRKFDPGDSDYDPDRTDRLFNELPGILNLVLDGLNRLRKRGRFDPPKSCNTARSRWQFETNAIHRFLAAHKEQYKPHSHAVPFKTMWERYRAWAVEEGGAKRYQRSSFRQALSTAGLGRQARGDVILTADWLDQTRLIEMLPVTIEELNNVCDGFDEEMYTAKSIRLIAAQNNLDIVSERAKLISVERSKNENS